MRLILFAACSILAAAMIPVRAGAQTPKIELPDLMAVQLPHGATTVAANDPAVTKVLLRASCPGYEVRGKLAQGTLGPGAIRVVWTAYQSGTQIAVAQRDGVIFVVPSGTVPVGLSGDENATAGNNASHIVRDSAGLVHMIWQDGGRPEGPTGAFYRRAEVSSSGEVRFETDAIPLARSGGQWNAYPSLATDGLIVHFVWQQAGTAHYRHLSRISGVWHWSDPIDLHVPSDGRDIGPAIDAASGVLHVVTPGGFYAISPDSGATWTTNQIPIPDGTHIKTVSVSGDLNGGAWIAMSIVVRQPPQFAKDHGSGGYWGLRVIHRSPNGQWSALIDPLTRFPEWTEPTSDADDVLVDWTRIVRGAKGDIHIAFHGTAVSRIYAHDQSYYLWQDPGGVWHPPVLLREPALTAGHTFSFAPSIALADDVVLPLTFYDVSSGGRWLGFDSVLRQFRDGTPIGSPLTVTRYAEDAIIAGEPDRALGSRFPAAAPRVFVGANGNPELDVLETLVPILPGAPDLIAYQRLDLSNWPRR